MFPPDGYPLLSVFKTGVVSIYGSLLDLEASLREELDGWSLFAVMPPLSEFTACVKTFAHELKALQHGVTVRVGGQDVIVRVFLGFVAGARPFLRILFLQVCFFSFLFLCLFQHCTVLVDVFFLPGDSKEGNRLAGTLSHSADRPCRFCHVVKCNCFRLGLEQEKPRTRPTADAQRATINAQPVGERAKDTMRGVFGISRWPGGFDELLFLPFLQLPIDPTHSESLGMFRVLMGMVFRFLKPTGRSLLDASVLVLGQRIGLSMKPIKKKKCWTATQFRAMCAHGSGLFAAMLQRPDLFFHTSISGVDVSWAPPVAGRALAAASEWVSVVWARELPLQQLHQHVQAAVKRFRAALKELGDQLVCLPNFHYGWHIALSAVQLGLPILADAGRLEALHLFQGGKTLNFNGRGFALRIMQAALSKESLVSWTRLIKSGQAPILPDGSAEIGRGFVVGRKVVEALREGSEGRSELLVRLTDVQKTKHNSGWSLHRNALGLSWIGGDGSRRLGRVTEREDGHVHVSVLEHMEDDGETCVETWCETKEECVIDAEAALPEFIVPVFPPERLSAMRREMAAARDLGEPLLWKRSLVHGRLFEVQKV